MQFVSDKVHKALAECLTLPRRPAVEDVREVVDRLEKLGADNRWPLPKPSEMLFIK
jgi:glutamine synthetase type III